MRHKKEVRMLDKAWGGKFVDLNELRYLQDTYLVQPPSCGVSLTSPQSIATSTFTVVTWDSQLWQHPSDAGFWSTSTTTTKQRFYAPWDGFYYLRFSWRWASYSTTNARRAEIHRASGGSVQEHRWAPINGWQFGDIAWSWQAAAGDYFYARVHHDHGSDFDLDDGCRFEIYRIGV